MIKYLKELFSKPVIMQTPVDELVMIAIVLGFIALLAIIVGVCFWIKEIIQKRNERKKK